ncbi:MAG: FAD-dependent oxidoreductase [Pseudoflavonifractor capillosus]|uniref:FAD-dependent oxidoreductase n=1 Tax=Pseudoflavonifractor capillosus TaxID=106588 RepID=UPI0023F9281B|nr:FAD-dependent oxidoreductase [Pseudoflavonifractor capillosus]MCI5928184.1 FAD-dependent oxidoreductase [Pseudoflavonifractor capillosus]MDY4659865.1 FAD-dependent oxidoreductase [Pseudoflavonifractor capillosus]
MKHMRTLLAGALTAAMLLSGCTAQPDASAQPSGSTTPAPSETGSAAIFTPGTYEGTGKGYGGDIKVSVTVDETSITDIEVVEQTETEGVGGAALPTLVDKVLSAQSVNIDGVSGATYTSDGFLTAVREAITASGADPDALGQGQTGGDEAKETVTMSTDVVVVGAGGAGLAAALTAAQNGADVVVLEKMAMVGGASSMAGGGTNATGSQWQQSYGIEDSPEAYFMDIMENGHFFSDARTLWLYANTQGAAFDWLVAEDGAALPYVNSQPSPSAEHSYGRTFSPEGGGAGVVSALQQKVTDLGVEILLETPAQELMVTDGTVTGVKALAADGTPYEITANSVILATGGYGANTDMLPETVTSLPYAGAVSATGDGLNMATAIGADAINLDKVNIQPHSIILPDGRGQHTFQGCLAMYNKTGSILVSDQGVRFVNEQGSANDIKAGMEQNEHSYLIMDAASFETYAQTCIASHNFTQEQLDQWLEANGTSNPVFAHADNPEDLAAIVGIPSGALTETVERYNGFVAAGEDTDFGRKVSTAMGDGPYYAVEMNLRYYATLGGLHINDNMQVLDTDGQPIQGLYAAGEVVGGVVGDIYAPGSLFGWAMTSGHNAGLAVTGNTVFEG